MDAAGQTQEQRADTEARELCEAHDILPESSLGRVIRSLVETNVINDGALHDIWERLSRLEAHNTTTREVGDDGMPT